MGFLVPKVHSCLSEWCLESCSLSLVVSISNCYEFTVLQWNDLCDLSGEVHDLSLNKKGGLKFSSILILLLFALFTNHSDPPSRGQDLENKTGSDSVDKKAMNSAFKA